MKDGWWKFQVNRPNLDALDNAEGIDIVLSVGDNNYGSNYLMDERSEFRFIDETDATRKLRTVGKEFESFGTKELSMNFYNYTVQNNWLRIPDSNLGLPEGTSFNPDTDPVTFNLDDLSITIPAGSFIDKGDNKFLFDNRAEGIKMNLNLNKNTWSLSLRRPNIWGEVDLMQDLNLYLSVGDSESGIVLQGIRKTWLKYNRQRFGKRFLHSGSGTIK